MFPFSLRRIGYLSATVLLLPAFFGGVCLGAYPSLIVNESDYAELRARTSLEPWAWMKDQAIGRASGGYGSIGTGDYSQVQSVLTSSALSYILDEPNQTAYKDQIYDGIITQLDNLNIGDSHGWYGTVYGGNVVFCAINALDVIYNDLTHTQQTDCMNTIQSKVNTISTSGLWPLARLGLHGAWDIFRGVSYNPDAYYNEVMADFTSDGIFTGGSNYANDRYNTDARLAKSMFIDILEHTGIDNRYYNNSTLQDFHEWMYSATAGPAKRTITFGDTKPGSLVYGHSQLYRAAKFGDEAAGYAGWFARDGYPMGDVYFTYVVPDADELFVVDGKTMPAPAAVKPKSKIYYQGGGWFWEDDTTEKSLMGAVWAATGYDSGHAHKESNAIYMAAYGEHVLLNSGYHTPYGDSWNNYPWSWFHNNARSANTVLVNNADHSSKSGGGVTEGFTSHGFDYSCSDDGPALSNDTHLRSFIFVKPQDGKNGYFLTFDDVDADNGETVNVLLHPNTKATTDIDTISDKKAYRATIDGLIFDGNTDVKLSVFYGTEPTSVTKENGAIGNGSTTFEAKYLNAQYDTDSSGNVQIATVLFPHNNTHAKAAMARLSGTGYNGASVDHGDGVVDYVLASDGVTNVTCAGATFTAKSVVFRQLDNEPGFYFVRDGWEFGNDGIGFEADSSDITIHVDELAGMIRSDGTNVKFLYPDLQEVWLDGELLSPVASGDGWVNAYVDAGTHDLAFVLPEPTITLALVDNGCPDTGLHSYTLTATGIGITTLAQFTIDGEVHQVFDAEGNPSEWLGDGSASASETTDSHVIFGDLRLPDLGGETWPGPGEQPDKFTLESITGGGNSGMGTLNKEPRGNKLPD